MQILINKNLFKQRVWAYEKGAISHQKVENYLSQDVNARSNDPKITSSVPTTTTTSRMHDYISR